MLHPTTAPLLICTKAAGMCNMAEHLTSAAHRFSPWFLGSQGGMFGVIGMGAGVVGTSMSNGLLALRKKLDPSFVSQNKPPDVVLNASTWALHMGISSNLRYQALNGFDMVRPTRHASPCMHEHRRVGQALHSGAGISC